MFGVDLSASHAADVYVVIRDVHVVDGVKLSTPSPGYIQQRLDCRVSACKTYADFKALKIYLKLECGPMPNVMAAQPNIGGALCESSVILFLVRRCKVWLTPAAGVP